MPHTIDVHGLRVAEAVRQTEKALREALTHGFPDIKVIVGKGLHSRNRTPVLKLAIIREMQM
jgi:DNA-nicking Smr family endonuclease